MQQEQKQRDKERKAAAPPKKERIDPALAAAAAAAAANNIEPVSAPAQVPSLPSAAPTSRNDSGPIVTPSAAAAPAAPLKFGGGMKMGGLAKGRRAPLGKTAGCFSAAADEADE